MDGGTYREDNKTTKFINSLKGEETVDSHDRQRPKGTEHIEEDNRLIKAFFQSLI